MLQSKCVEVGRQAGVKAGRQKWTRQAVTRQEHDHHAGQPKTKAAATKPIMQLQNTGTGHHKHEQNPSHLNRPIMQLQHTA